jgi:arginine decarboxylase
VNEERRLPVYDKLAEFANAHKIRFCMPSHKGKEIGSFLDGVFPFDITELPDTDNLYISEGIIGEAEDKAAKIFKSCATCFSANGASACVKAMLSLACGINSAIIADRFCHHSAIDAFSLLDIKPYWLYPKLLEPFGIPLPPTPLVVKEALEKEKTAKAVFITSPNYYGLIADIKGIAEICKEKNVYLLVDNAHGTHFAFMDQGKNHPNCLGADFVTDSAHKTLPVLTGGAMLHINTPSITRKEALKALSLFSSSSPSYLILASLDFGIEWARGFREEYNKLASLIGKIKKDIKEIGFLCLDLENTDSIRLTIYTEGLGINGFDAYHFLYSKNIACEMADYKNIVLILSPQNTKEDFDFLMGALKELSQCKGSTPFKSFPITKTKALLSIREATFSKSKAQALDQCEGKISAETITLYPPSVPVLIAGELITREIIDVIREYNVRDEIRIIMQNAGMQNAELR